MYKNLLLYIHKFLIIGFWLIIILLPYNLHIFNLCTAVFPAFDLIIIYYHSTNRKTQAWQLLICGLFLDQLYKMNIGVNSLILIIADLILQYIYRLCLIKKYETNMIIFCGYAFFVIAARYFLITILSINYIEGSDVIFHYFTTIFSYPIIYIMLEKSYKILVKNVG